MNKKIILLIALFSLTKYSLAVEVDSTYIRKFKNIFAVKTFLVNNDFLYTITPRNTLGYSSKELKDSRILYEPHIPPSIGISLNIEGIGLTYVFKSTDINLDTTGKIKSDFKQFQMNFYKNTFGLEAYYQDYKSFYFHYTGNPERNFNSNIRAYQFGVNTIFIMNGKKFSYNAAFNQTEFQKKTAGSFLLMLSLKFNEIKGDNLIPEPVKKYYPNFNNLERNRNYAFLIHPGYALNVTKNNFYFSTAALVGVGIQNQTYNFPNDKEYKIAFPLSGRAKAGLGYNGQIFFAGVYANGEITQSVIRPMKTQQILLSYGLYLGLRAVKLNPYKKSRKQLHDEAKKKKEEEKEIKRKQKEEVKKKKRKK